MAADTVNNHRVTLAVLSTKLDHLTADSADRDKRQQEAFAALQAQLAEMRHEDKQEHRQFRDCVDALDNRVTRNEEVFELTENQSTYIPLGAVHRLENPGAEPLHVIEVQSGGYLGEDDIVRLEDTYGRA